MMKFSELLEKTTVATVVAAVVVLVGICYSAYTKNTEAVMLLAGAGIGYLFKEVKKNETS